MPKTLKAIAAAAVAISAAVAGAGAQPAQAASHMEVALQDDAVFLYRSYYDRNLAFMQARELGVTRLRVNVLWDRVVGAQARRTRRPAQVLYNWGPWDSVVDDAARYGIKVQMTVAGPAPAWATRNHRVGPYRPNAREYGRFMRELAAHFKGRVDRYSVWNEPNWKGWLAPQKSAPGIYRELYRAGWSAVKSVDPRAQVLFGELAPLGKRRGLCTPPLTFVRRAARHAHLKADGFAHHPYSITYGPRARVGGRNDVTMGTLGRLRRLLHGLARSRHLRTTRGGALPIYLTEWGYFARGPRAVPMSRRKAYVRQTFEVARRTPGVRQLTQYLLVSPGHRVPWDTSIVSRGHRLSPVYRVIRKWARHAAASRLIARTALPRS